MGFIRNEKIFDTRYIAYLLSMILSQFISIINAYIFHKYFTFQSSLKGLKMIKEFLKFSTIYLLAILVNIFLLTFLIEIINISVKLAGGLAILPVTLVSYLAHSKFSFKHS